MRLTTAVPAVPAVLAACLLAGCVSTSGSARLDNAPREAPTGAPPDAPPRSIATAAIPFVAAPPAGARRLGVVAASADARYEGALPAAERAAEAELRRQAAAIGASLLVPATRDVAELEPEPLPESIADTFDGATRDRLRPGGTATPQRPIYRVRLTADAYAAPE